VAEYILDTHACVFALAHPRKLGAAARRVLESKPGRVWIPAAVAAEIALLRELGRIGLGLPELRAAIDGSECLRFLDLTFEQIEIFGSLGGIRDPFDRLVVSAARARRAKLISKDDALVDTGLVDVVWR
jgi:PIN domain nuclease of toxin-antitoxin system